MSKIIVIGCPGSGKSTMTFKMCVKLNYPVLHLDKIYHIDNNNHKIEAARICLARYTKRQGKIWIRVFPHLSKSKKPLQVRMGSGKGAPDKWVAVVKEGTILFEMAGIDETLAREALRLASYKLPIKCKVVTRKCGE